MKMKWFLVWLMICSSAMAEEFPEYTTIYRVSSDTPDCMVPHKVVDVQSCDGKWCMVIYRVAGTHDPLYGRIKMMGLDPRVKIPDVKNLALGTTSEKLETCKQNEFKPVIHNHKFDYTCLESPVTGRLSYCLVNVRYRVSSDCLPAEPIPIKVNCLASVNTLRRDDIQNIAKGIYSNRELFKESYASTMQVQVDVEVDNEKVLWAQLNDVACEVSTILE